jgi:hypothetical protein
LDTGFEHPATDATIDGSGGRVGTHIRRGCGLSDCSCRAGAISIEVRPLDADVKSANHSLDK